MQKGFNLSQKKKYRSNLSGIDNNVDQQNESIIIFSMQVNLWIIFKFYPVH